MPEVDPYTALADWYDIEHDAITEDIEFFAQQIAALGTARPRILEIGSGTGRIAAGLALYRGDGEAALEHWRAVADAEPLAVDAHGNIARLLSQTQGDAAAWLPT